jgi:hypothetical protein
MNSSRKLTPMLELAKTIKEADYKLNIEDILNLIYYYSEIEAKEIEQAYMKSTIEQCKSVSVMFSEKEMIISEDEMKLIIIDAKKYISDNYNTTEY